MPPIRGFFLLGGGSYFISPMVRLFFLAMTMNSAPNVSPPLRWNFETVSFLKALKLDRVSVTPRSLPSVLERFSRKFGVVWCVRLRLRRIWRFAGLGRVCVQGCFLSLRLS